MGKGLTGTPTLPPPGDPGAAGRCQIPEEGGGHQKKDWLERPASLSEQRTDSSCFTISTTQTLSFYVNG